MSFGSFLSGASDFFTGSGEKLSTFGETIGATVQSGTDLLGKIKDIFSSGSSTLSDTKQVLTESKGLGSMVKTWLPIIGILLAIVIAFVLLRRK